LIHTIILLSTFQFINAVMIDRYLNNGAQVALVGRDIETLSKIGEQFPT